MNATERAQEVYCRLRGHRGTDFALLKGGLSNETFLVDGKEVLRIKLPSDPAFFNPISEKKALEAIAPLRLSPRLLAYEEKTGNMVTAFVKGTSFLTRASDGLILSSLGATIRLYQGLSAALPPFDAETRLAAYKEEAQEKDDLPGEGVIRSNFGALQKKAPLVYAHNDLVASNLLLDESKKGLCLLDYEFAGLNTPLFDLASLLSENDLRKPSQIETLLEGYLRQKPTEESIASLRLTMAYEDILWYYWALARYRESKKAIYLEIAFDKVDYLEKDSQGLNL